MSKMTGEELKAYRVSQGLSQRAFAPVIGVSRKATVSDYEQEKREIPKSIELLIEKLKELEKIKKIIEK